MIDLDRYERWSVPLIFPNYKSQAGVIDMEDKFLVVVDDMVFEADKSERVWKMCAGSKVPEPILDVIRAFKPEDQAKAFWDLYGVIADTAVGWKDLPIQE